MDTQLLIKQWNDRMILGNQLSREIEDFESIISTAKEGEVAICEQGVGTTYLSVLSPEAMQELKEVVLGKLILSMNEKVSELEQLIGKAPEQKKATFVKPELEQIIPVDPEPAPSEEQPKRTELTVGLVKRLYHEKDMTLEQIAEQTGVPRATLYTFISKNGLRKPSKKEKEVFRDSQVVSKKKP